MPEENKIDYTGIQIPDMESIKRTSRQFTDGRRSMGFQTEEEKNAALKAEMQAAQQRFNDQDLWNSEDPYEVYNSYETDPAKQAEFQRNGQMVAGIGSTIATLPFTAGMMGGIPALTTTTTGVAGGYAGAYGGQKLGQYLDNKYGGNTTPGLSTIGGIGGGILGGGMGYRGTIKLGSRGGLPKGGQTMYGKQFVGDVVADALTRQLKKVPSKIMMDYYRDYNFLFSELTDPDRFVHVSPNPISGKNVSVGAAHSNGVNWVPGNAHVSKVGDDNMVGLGTGKPYRNRSSDQTFISIPKTEGMVQTRQPGAVGVPQIDLTHNTTKIITKNPITGGFERQLVISPTQSSKGAHTGFERPSTYFKGATYAGKPGTYAGKEVPTGQLPKGQRNQPHNPTATERIYSVLGRDPDVPTGGIDLANGVDTPQNRTLLSMRDFLQQHGVDTKNITLDDLENLYRKRLNSIKIASNDNYNLALPRGEGAFPKQGDIRAFDQEGLVGRMSITGPTRKQPDMLQEIGEKYHKSHPGASVDMIENNTRIEIGSKKIPGRSPVKGVSQRLYDAGIPVAQQTNNGQGLMSGEMYLQPQRSTAVMEHYPAKQIIRNNGEWHGENLDPAKVTTKNNPVYLLTQPSGRYIHIPTKSSLFFPSAIKDGQITTNINHGSIFLEDGGKIKVKFTN